MSAATMRKVRVAWHVNHASATKPTNTDDLILPDGNADPATLRQLLLRAYPGLAEIDADVVVDTVTPRDLVSALVILVGPPGSGKTTWANARFAADQIECLDSWRKILTGDEADQSATPTASKIQDLVIAERMSRGLLTVIDGTNAEPHHRRRAIDQARLHGLPVVAVRFMLTVDECMANMAGRDRQVPRDDVKRIDLEIEAGMADLAATTDVLLTVDQHGDTIRITGHWRGIDHFTPWRTQLEARARKALA